jgi:hypothetical protein
MFQYGQASAPAAKRYVGRNRTEESMPFTVLVKATILWVAILVCAILNGALREQVLIPSLGHFTGAVASGFILSAVILVVALVAVPWYGSLRAKQWWLLGLLWLVLTMVFEFSFGRLVQHNTWRELIEAYTFKNGNIWPVVLVATLIAPRVSARMRGQT